MDKKLEKTSEAWDKIETLCKTLHKISNDISMKDNNSSPVSVLSFMNLLKKILTNIKNDLSGEPSDSSTSKTHANIALLNSSPKDMVLDTPIEEVSLVKDESSRGYEKFDESFSSMFDSFIEKEIESSKDKKSNFRKASQSFRQDFSRFLNFLSF